VFDSPHTVFSQRRTVIETETGANIHASYQYQAVLSHIHLDNRVCIEFEVWRDKRL